MTYSVLLSPVSTEKTARLGSDNQCAFYVTQDANKIEVAQAIHMLYGVQPVSVRMIKLPQKKSGRGRVKRTPCKKAVVTLPAGKKIDPLKTA